MSEEHLTVVSYVRAYTVRWRAYDNFSKALSEERVEHIRAYSAADALAQFWVNRDASTTRVEGVGPDEATATVAAFGDDQAREECRRLAVSVPQEVNDRACSLYLGVPYARGTAFTVNDWPRLLRCYEEAQR